jgi:hyperosmotically inducible periplasmic protein
MNLSRAKVVNANEGDQMKPMCFGWMLLLWTLPLAAQAQLDRGSGVNTRLAQEVRHQLAMLPYYSVFDNLEFRIEGTKVILSGQVTRPSLKSDAETVVRRLEGVNKIVNEIQVLPLSPDDDRLRIAAYRAIYSKEPLQIKYGVRAVPPIHIIVNNGNVTLEGVVDSQADKDLAGLAANGVPGIFSVKNNLRVEQK